MFKIAHLMESKGHKVAYFAMHHPDNVATGREKYFVSQVDYHGKGSFLSKLSWASAIIYNREANRKFDALIREFKPDLIQAHNVYHQISPSIYGVAKKHGVPVVQFLHDYKVACPVYTLLRDGRVCEGLCRNNRYFQCTLKRCNEGSVLKSLVNTVEMYAHNVWPDYYGMVDLYVSPSQFLADTVTAMGFSPKRMVTMLHFADPGDSAPQYGSEKREIIYFGRLSGEKGIQTLIRAVKGLDVTLKIIGSGPLKEELEAMTVRENMSNVVFFPHLAHDEVMKQLGETMFSVTPSEWNENCPNTVFESFLCGKPVIGSRMGGIPEMVIDNRTGLTFEAGNADDLREKIVTLLSDPDRIVALGKNARVFAEEELNMEKYYTTLMNHLALILKKQDIQNNKQAAGGTR
jgi:glycosyltransferase involved in cell wall biosynthesis